MPIHTEQFTLGTATATKICAASSQGQVAMVHNDEHSQSDRVYVGNANVTTANGLHIDSVLTFQIQLDPGSDLWAISDTDGSLVHTLCIKQD